MTDEKQQPPMQVIKVPGSPFDSLFGSPGPSTDQLLNQLSVKVGPVSINISAKGCDVELLPRDSDKTYEASGKSLRDALITVMEAYKADHP